jgi:hypothetical protein
MFGCVAEAPKRKLTYRCLVWVGCQGAKTKGDLRGGERRGSKTKRKMCAHWHLRKAGVYWKERKTVQRDIYKFNLCKRESGRNREHRSKGLKTTHRTATNETALVGPKINTNRPREKRHGTSAAQKQNPEQKQGPFAKGRCFYISDLFLPFPGRPGGIS